MKHEEQTSSGESGRPDALDALLRRHFDDALGSQVGTAGERFARYIDGARPAPAPSTPRQADSPRFMPFWSIGLIGGALAAALSIVMLRHVLVPPSSPRHLVQPKPTPDGTRSNIELTSAQQDLQWQTFDQGVVELDDGTPAQRLYRRQLNTVRWYDPKRKATIEYSTPHEETVFVGLNKY